jgi:hypothetical protein
MSKNLLLLNILLICACSPDGIERINDPFLNWGHLPSLESIHWENVERCSRMVYDNNLYRVPDVEHKLQIKGETTTGIGHSYILSPTCYQATISTRIFQNRNFHDKNYYSISVEMPTRDDRCMKIEQPTFCKSDPIAYAILFRRELEGEMVGDFYKDKKISEIVFFDKKENRVEFNVNGNVYVYQLPRL